MNEIIKTLKEKYCDFCGTQRCTGEGEWLLACPHYQKLLSGIYEENEKVNEPKPFSVQKTIEAYIDSVRKEGYRAAIEDSVAWLEHGADAFFCDDKAYEHGQVMTKCFKEAMLEKIDNYD